MSSPAAAPITSEGRIPLVDLAAQYRAIGAEVNAAIQRVLDNTDFIMGAAVKEFEDAFATYCGAEHGIGVSSGTDALFLVLRALDLKAGDEVIIPSMTFTATAEAVVHCGATPVFVDVNSDDLQIDVEAAAKAITPRTRGIIPVHLYGMAADLDALLSLTQANQMWLLEDAAQAHGGTWRGRHVGTFGIAGCFSFYPGKNLGAYGDAGMVVTANPELARTVRMLRDHGRTSKYLHDRVGYGSRLDTLQAAVLGVKLRHLDAWTQRRRAAAVVYDELIGDRLRRVGSSRREGAVHHIYAVRVPSQLRDQIVARLQSEHIGAGIHYPVPLHLQPAYQGVGRAAQPLSESERAGAELLSLPLYPEITREQQERVVRSLFVALDEATDRAKSREELAIP